MTYNIVVTIDDNYARHTAVLISSICHNNPNHHINIFVLDNNISNENKEKLNKLKNKYGKLTIEYIYFDEKKILTLLGEVKSDRSISAYARLFIPMVISKDIDRVVYFDVDAICCGSIEEAFNMDMCGYYLAGVRDCNFKRNLRAVGIENELYINAGMLIWNLKTCREDNVVQMFIDFVKNKKGNVIGLDQGTINGTLSKKIMELHPKWNCLTPFYQFNKSEILGFYEMESYYSDENLQEAIQSPIFVHFVPNFITRPWVEHCKHPLASEYIKYQNETEFRDSVLDSDRRKIKQKIEANLFHYLPNCIFIFFHKLIRNIK